MRNKYPIVLLRSDGGYAAQEFFKGIRFSSHCEYKLSGFHKDYENFSFPHIRKYNEDLRENLDLVFEFEKNNYSIGKSEIIVVPLIQKFFLKNIVYKKKLDILSLIDYVRNPSGQFEYVCSITKKKFPIYDKLPIEIFIKDLDAKLNSYLVFAKTITIKIIEFKKETEGYFELQINHVSPAWHLYRSIGINLPLLIMQTQLGRNVSTYPMVNYEDLLVSGLDIKYKMKDKKIFWFDLDETLICRDTPVFQLIDILNIFLKNKKVVSLLTRHTYEISKTLEKINLSIEIFNDIVKVEGDQLKSFYVNVDDVFVDNEYPQRLDVRKNTNAMVLDLDQIDFIDFNSF